MDLRQEAQAFLLGNMFRQNEDSRETVLKLSSISEKNDKMLQEKTEKTFQEVILYFAILGCILALLCIILTLLFVKLIASPLQLLSSQAEKIAYGDLSVRIEVREGSDEISTLQRSFGMMVESLKSVYSEIKNSVDDLNKISSSMQDSMEKGFPDTASIIKHVETNSVSIKNISSKLKSFMSEFMLNDKFTNDK
jgi:methyl-accepting chemotaxis protein